MKNLNKIAKMNLNWFEKSLLFLPVTVWFSYLPNIKIGRSEGTNLELSIALIFVVISAILGFFEVTKNFTKLKHNRYFLLSAGFVGWNFLSFIWSENRLRTILNSGVWLMIWLIFAGALASKKIKKLTPLLVEILIKSSTTVAILAIFQVAYGAFSDFGLCRGCVAQGFGFVRPAVFAIEPQFLGSLFLAPILILLWQFLKIPSRKIAILAFINLIAMYLTLSRGAIFALILAIFALVFLMKKPLRANLRLLALIVVSFATGMLWHALFTQLNPRVTDGFYDSISKSINQMSLGKITLPKIQKQPESKPQNSNLPEPKKSSFDGYVAKSTDERTGLSGLAVQVWRQNPQTILFGVGAGGAGKAIFARTHKIASPFEIVQNEFLSILLELGALGLGIWLAIAGGFMKAAHQNNRLRALSLAIFVGFLVQWNFFSGLPNALHIYLILAILFVNLKEETDVKIF